MTDGCEEIEDWTLGDEVYLLLDSVEILDGGFEDDTTAAIETSPVPSQPTFLGQSHVCNSGLILKRKINWMD